VSRHRFSAFEIGESAEATIAVTDRHFEAAGELFHDHHPIHYDDAYAIERGHPGRTLPGSVIGGIMSSALAAMLSESGLAMLEYAVRYRAPVYAGDTLTARCRVVRTEPKPHRGGGLLFLETTLHNQDGVLVAEGRAVDLASDEVDSDVEVS
jgi:3-hydroxybutyryl-CoA dehydratase